MSEMVQVPAAVWRQLLNDMDFLKKIVVPLAKGFKHPQWMTAEDIMNPSDPQYLKIGRERLKQIRASGAIRMRKAGRFIEYYRKDIEAYKEGEITISNKKAAAVTAAH